jgi:hypothetical protein
MANDYLMHIKHNKIVEKPSFYLIIPEINDNKKMCKIFIHKMIHYIWCP